MKRFCRCFWIVLLALLVSAPISFASEIIPGSSEGDCQESGGCGDQGSKKSKDYGSREFIQAFSGTGSFLFPGMPVKNGEWQVHCPPVYEETMVDTADNMKPGFRFSDIFPWNWGGNMHKTSVEGKMNKEVSRVSCMDYWPKHIAYPDDKVLGVARIMGDPNEPEELYFGQAIAMCAKNYGSSRVAIRSRIHVDGDTIGNSIGLGGAGAKIADAGGESVAFAVGGQLGKNRTRAEDYVEFEILCMNDGPTKWKKTTSAVEKPKAPHAVETPKAETERPSCEWIWEKIHELEKLCKDCKYWCSDNLGFRVALQKNFIELYVCTGKVHSEYLKEAMENHRIAVDNFNQGSDIERHRVAAKQLMEEADYLHSGCIYILNGEKKAIDFAKEKKLERYATDFN